MENELLILGLLRKQEMHGYQITELIDRNLSVCTDLKKSLAYFLLDKMAGEGWISFEETREGKRPVKRVYRLTEKGEAEFQRLLRENLAGYHRATFGSDTGVAFLDTLPAAEAIQLLRQRLEMIRQIQAGYRDNPHQQGPIAWVVEHQQRHLQAEVDWVSTLIERISEKKY
jgi:DNA-binding PadR family transcriptional regulator